jgi:redox-sensitive bicupin YhaK (pirin superfamily)
MPQQQAGRMRGFQLWINLPAREKMKPAHYRDIPPAEIPVVKLENGGEVKVIAGKFAVGDRVQSGAIVGVSTDPTYFDVHLPKGASFSHQVGEDYNAFVYPYEGSVTLGGDLRALAKGKAGVLNRGDTIQVTAAEEARFLVLAAKPIGEPVVQYGPFVMNTSQEIEQAIRDFQSGSLA